MYIYTNAVCIHVYKMNASIIRESVESLCRDETDTPIV